MGGEQSREPSGSPLASDLLWLAVETLSDLMSGLAVLAAEVRRLEEEVFVAELDNVRLTSAALRRVAASLRAEQKLPDAGGDRLE